MAALITRGGDPKLESIRKVSSRSRHVSSRGLFEGLLRGLVDPRDGGQLRRLRLAVPESLGVSGVGRVQGLLPLGADLGRGAEVHLA